MIRYVVIKNIKKEDCEWIDSEIINGTVLYQYEGNASNFISSTDVAVTFNKDGSGPYFGVPRRCLRFDQET